MWTLHNAEWKDGIPYDREVWEDKDVILKYVKENGVYFQKASKELRNDPNFILEALEIAKINGEEIVKYIGKDLQSDKEFISKCIKINGEMFKYLNQELREDREILIEALNSEVKVDGISPLEYTSEELKSDEEIARIAIKQNRRAFFSINSELKDNVEFLVLAYPELTMDYVRGVAGIFMNLDIDLGNDPKDCVAALALKIKEDYRNISLIPDEVQKENIDLLIEDLIDSKGYAIKYFSEELKCDMRIIWFAIKNYYPELLNIDLKENYTEEDAAKVIEIIDKKPNILEREIIFRTLIYKEQIEKKFAEDFLKNENTEENI